MRIKARALGLAAEDYFNDKVLEDTDLLYTGMRELPADFWDQHGKDMEIWQQGGHTYYRVTGPLVPQPAASTSSSTSRRTASRRSTRRSRRSAARPRVLQTLQGLHATSKNNVWGITARNREQNFALNLLMDPEIDFVTLLGQAGTGKTLLTLAAGLTQTLDDQALHRDHHDARHGAGRRGHRLPARHRGREDEPVDGRARRQPRSAATRPTTAPANGAAPRRNDLIRSRIKIKSAQLHARPHVPEQVS